MRPGHYYLHFFCGLLLFAGITSPAPASTLFVSQLGDDTDGSSWQHAFRSIQKALDAIPDEKGGHTILVRPDTYMEANLAPAFAGAKGQYNVLTADSDGSRGSGRSGFVIIDSSDPSRGLKSVDWWSPFKANPEFSASGWDRWKISHIMATGGDAGLFWDFPPRVEPFSLTVEDSTGIGRAFGGGAAHFQARPDEPVIFRRCKLYCLDWWGDAAGAYVRAENSQMPDAPDITFEDCTLVGPDNALQAGNPGFSGHTRILLKRCHLISQNFSQPRGTPGSGVIYSTIEGRFLHVDLEDCTLMGYKVFGAGQGEVGYSVHGDVKAYVQFEQAVPAGIHRLSQWPAETFGSIAPPVIRPATHGLTLEKIPVNSLCESAPIVWKDRLCLFECVRPASGGHSSDYSIRLTDFTTHEEMAHFAEGYGLACAIVYQGVFHVFASRFASDSRTWNDVTHFKSSDLKNWESEVVIRQENEHLFNSSVCTGKDGFILAYESDDSQYRPFSIKFAHSADLQSWKKLPEAVFGKDRYTACPAVRYADGWYYLLYLEQRSPRWFFETWIARSQDLISWELSLMNPVLSPDDLDGINASDPDIAEFQGRTYLVYSVGDQLTWSKSRVAIYPGSINEFFRSFFP